MTLTEKVKSILLELGEYKKAHSIISVQCISNNFYEQYNKDPKNYIPLKQFIQNEMNKA